MDTQTPLRTAVEADIPRLVELSGLKRRAYAEIRPKFWRPADDADARQAAWFEHLLGRDDHLVLVAEENETVRGFVIARVMPAPPVYDPGGLTSHIDDYCVDSDEAWATVGRDLLLGVWARLEEQGAVQVHIVCGVHDDPKLKTLRAAGLEPTSTRYAGTPSAG